MFGFVNKYIKWKVAVPVALVVLASTVALVLVASAMFNAAMLNRTSDFLLQQNRAQAYRFQGKLNSMLHATELLGIAARTMIETGDPSRETFMAHMSETVMLDPDFIGVFALFEPGAFDGRDGERSNEPGWGPDGRFNAYVQVSGGRPAWDSVEIFGDEELDAWYNVPMRTGGLSIVGPFLYPVGGVEQQVVSFAVPVTYGGEPVGVAGVDILFSTLVSGVMETHFFESGHMFVMQSDGMLLYSAIEEDTGTSAFGHLDPVSAAEWRAAAQGDGEFNRIVTFPALGIDFKISTVPSPIGDRHWHIGSFVPVSEIRADTARIVVYLAVIALGFGAAAMAVLFAIINRLVSVPVNRMVDVAEDIANGRININIDGSGKDEMGALVRRFKKMAASVSGLIDATNGMARRIRDEGDIDARVDAGQFKGAYAEMSESINETIGGIYDDFSVTFDAIREITRGDFGAKAPEFRGKKAVLGKRVEELKSNLNQIYVEVSRMTKAVGDGEIRHRIALDGFGGDWKGMMRGLNEVMESFCEPLAEIEVALGNLSRGSFDTRVSGKFRGEFLEISERVNKTLDRIAAYIKEVADVLGAMADGDLTRTITAEYMGDFAKIKNGLNNINETLNQIVREVTQTAIQVAQGAIVVQDSSQGLTASAEEQAASVEELHSSLTLISEGTKDNAAQARQAAAHSERSVESAVRGNGDMQKMLASMQGVKEASGKITNINRVIEDIAFQTNLLALNAAVEAARAGEHGLGFSVVAEEVRSLASKSQEAAQETSALIEDSVRRVNESMEMSGQTASALGTIVEDVSKVAAIISSIAEASGQQAEMVSQVHLGLSTITDAAMSNSLMTEKTAEASSELTAQAEVMHEMVGVFKTQ